VQRASVRMRRLMVCVMRDGDIGEPELVGIERREKGRE